tara:strand:+ start:364 stop:747 length:384 start_codon:yes stop_codon:yes gene_type:complete
MPSRVITQVTLDNFHEVVPEYIYNTNKVLQTYDDTKEMYLSMLKDNYLFTIDRDILIACLTDLTFMYAPGDDLNKDAVIDLLVLEPGLDEDSDEDDSDDGIDRRIHFPPNMDTSLEPQPNEDCTSGL